MLALHYSLADIASLSSLLISQTEEEFYMTINKLKNSKPINQIKYVVLLMSVVIVPTICFGSLVFAQNSPITQDQIQRLAGQDVSYWLIALAGLSITSWSFVVKWGLNQLEGQRTANAVMVTQLVTYMKEDHTATLVAMKANTSIMEKLGEYLTKKDEKEQIEKALHGGMK